MVDTVGMANSAPTPTTVQYSGRQARQLNGTSLAGATAARPLGVLTGVRPGTPANTVTATSTTWTCQPHAGVADVMVAAESGGYPFAFDAVATGAMTAADASNPRIDIIYDKIVDPEDGSTTPTASRGYLAGTAAASPVPKPAPAGAFVIAQINVPKVGGGSPTVTWVAPYTVAAGAIWPVDTLAHLKLITGDFPGQYADVFADTFNGLYRWSGTAWMWVSGTVPHGAVAVPVLSNGSVTSALPITFPAGFFATAPLVFLTVGNVRLTASVQDITTSGANIFVANWSGQATTGASTVSWEAVPS